MEAVRYGRWLRRGAAKRARLLRRALCAVAITPALLLIPSLTATASANGGQTGCLSSSSLGSLKEDPELYASYTEWNGTADYSFASSNRNPVGGNPGLMDYCVYPSSQPHESGISYSNFNGAWSSSSGSGYFDLGSGDGGWNNLPFDGSTQTIGWGNWHGGAPSGQKIVLHIDDPHECSQLYGGNQQSCYVNPCKEQEHKASGLTATTTATATLTRKYTWGITKSVKNPVVDNSGPTTATYTVTVTHSGPTESGWAVSGEIAVTNPTGNQISGVEVTDSINDKNATCTVTGGTNITVAANSTIKVHYTCTYSAAPSSNSETDTAEVKWPGQGPCRGSLQGAGTTTATAPITWSTATATVIDGSVTVKDSMQGTLGTVTSSESGSKVFEYTREFANDPAGTCTTHENTAMFTTNTTGTTGSASQTVKHCVGANLTIAKTSATTLTRTYKWGVSKSATPTESSSASGSAAYKYKVSVTHDGGTDSAWIVTGTITVTNPNNWESVTLTGVSDEVSNGGSCHITSGNAKATIPAGGKAELAYECTYAHAPTSYSFTNTAAATWEKSAASTSEASASTSAPASFTSPAKVVDGSVTVKDSIAGTLGTVTFEEASPKTFEYSHEFTGDPAGTCTTHENTATIKTNTTGTESSASQPVKHCVGANLTITNTASPSFTRTYKWGVTKTAEPAQLNNSSSSASAGYKVTVSHDGGTDSAWTVSGEITVKNPNNWESVTLTGVSDEVNNGGSCHITSGNDEATIPAHGETKLAYECTYAHAPSKAAFESKATATWNKTTASTPEGGAASESAGEFGAPAKIVDGSVTVKDTIAGTLGTVTYSEPSPRTFEYTHGFSGDPAGTCTTHENTATIKTNTTGTESSASQPFKHCVGANLTITNTATPSFTRTYKWGVTKSAEPAQLNNSGSSASSNYKVTVSHDGGTDSAWTVSGEISVKNPNNWESVTLTGVSDEVNNGGTCHITSGNVNATLAPGGETTLQYECSYEAAPSKAAFTSKATATWSESAASTPEGSATSNAKGEFNAPTKIVDGSVTVKDTLAGTLGTVTYNEPSPKIFEYGHEFTGDPAGACTTHENTATIKTNTTGTESSASQPFKHCVGANLTVKNTASAAFSRAYKWGIKKSVDSSEVKSDSGSETSKYTVSVTHDKGTDGGWVVTGEITVTNPNDWEPVTLTGVSDKVSNGGTCHITSGNAEATIPAEGEAKLDYECTYAEEPSGAAFTDTAAATWSKSAANTPSGSASSETSGEFTGPTKVIDGSVTVTDSLGGTLGTVTAEEESPKTIEYSHEFTGDPAGACTTHENTATITTNTTHTEISASQPVTHCVGADLKISNSVNASFTRTYKWGVTKSAEPAQVDDSTSTASTNYTVTVTHDGGTDEGWIAVGSITVKNPNSWESVTLTGVSDEVSNGGDCHITSGNAEATIPAEGEVTLGYECSYTHAPAKGPFASTATASWNEAEANTPNGSATGESETEFGGPAKVIDGSVTVKDTLAGNLGTVTAEEESPKTFEYGHRFTGDPAGTCTTHENTATITTDTTGAETSASQPFKHCVGANLTVSKTATPSFTRSYRWSITKTASPTEITNSSGSATFNYAVHVSHTAGIDSAWTVTGNVKVANPNDWEPITLTGVTDEINNGGSCHFTSGNTEATIPAGGEETLGYECTYAEAPARATFTNTATATWDAAAADTPNSSADGTASGEFGEPTNVINGSVNVTDSLAGNLGTVSASEASPKTFEYSHEFTGDPEGQCTTHENIATFVTDSTGTEGSASRTVKHCVEAHIETCTTAIGAGHETGGGEKITFDNHLSTVPAVHKNQFEYSWDNRGHHVRLVKLTSATCEVHGNFKVFKGEGEATLDKVKGYTISFTITVGEGKTYLSLTVSKGGTVVYSVNELGPIKKSTEKIT